MNDAMRFESECAALKDTLRVLPARARCTPPVAERWERIFHEITPQQLYDRFQRTAGEGNDVEMKVSLFKRQAIVEIRHNSSLDAQDHEANIIKFKLNGTHALLHRAFLKSDDQGAHLAKRYLQTSVSLFKEIGMTDLDLEAIKVGGYCWAKYGFCPDSEESWIKLSGELLKRLDMTNNTIKYRSDTYPVPPRDIALLSQLLHMDYDQASQCFPQLAEMNQVIGSSQGRPITISKALLLDSAWTGTLPLDDRNLNYQRFQSYVFSGQAIAREVA